MSTQLSFSAGVSALTMAFFALTALLGGFDQVPSSASGGGEPFAIYSLVD